MTGPRLRLGAFRVSPSLRFGPDCVAHAGRICVRLDSATSSHPTRRPSAPSTRHRGAWFGDAYAGVTSKLNGSSKRRFHSGLGASAMSPERTRRSGWGGLGPWPFRAPRGA